VKTSNGQPIKQTECFCGYEAHVSLNSETELITSVQVTAGNRYDGHELPRLLKKDLAQGTPDVLDPSDEFTARVVWIPETQQRKPAPGALAFIPRPSCQLGPSSHALVEHLLEMRAARASYARPLPHSTASLLLSPLIPLSLLQPLL
jgi:hypothetical protein